ncbi:hypothetical protein WT97_07730 [Burkholderia sp. MSMB1459WGS]|nr:hypothetical protein WT97_07730 [Burkholderia sp. MSMB1459WGS]
MSEAVAGLCIRFVALLETEEADTGHGFSSQRTICDLFNGYAHAVGENIAEAVHSAHLHGFADTTMTHEIGHASIMFDMSGRLHDMHDQHALRQLRRGNRNQHRRRGSV